MKKINLLLCILLTVISCQGKADSSAVIEYCPDYYNPYAYSFMWHFKYSEVLEKDQRIKIIFLRKDTMSGTTSVFGEYILENKQTDADIYWFMQNKLDDVQYTFRISVVPCETVGNSWTFYHRPASPYKLTRVTNKKLLVPVDREMLLAKFCEQPLNGNDQSYGDMITNITTVFLSNQPSEKTSDYLAMEILVKITLFKDLQATQTLTNSLSDLSEKDLFELKEKVEKDFQQGQGVLPDLNAVHHEISRRSHNAKTGQK